MADMNASADSGRLVQAAQTQTLFRALNEGIRELNETLACGKEGGWVCECEDGSCIEKVELTPDEYEWLRADGNRFAVKPGHENPAVEDVTDRFEQYLVVAKRGAGGLYATTKNPRTPPIR
jgi:hypothetical protein